MPTTRPVVEKGSSFEELYTKYRAGFVSVALRYVQNRMVAEDIVSGGGNRCCACRAEGVAAHLPRAWTGGFHGPRPRDGSSGVRVAARPPRLRIVPDAVGMPHCRTRGSAARAAGAPRQPLKHSPRGCRTACGVQVVRSGGSWL